MDVEVDTPIDELDKLIETLYEVRSLSHTAYVRHSCTAPSEWRISCACHLDSLRAER